MREYQIINTLLFIRIFQILVCTDCAGMGIHIPGLNFVVNIGEIQLDTCIPIKTHRAAILFPRAAKEPVESAAANW